MSFYFVEQFPVLPPSSYSPADLAFIAPRVLELTYSSHSMAPFARDLGYDGPPFAWDENRRAQLRAELDAWYARAYGLTRDELRYILDPADVKGLTWAPPVWSAPSVNSDEITAAIDVLHDDATSRRFAEDMIQFSSEKRRIHRNEYDASERGAKLDQNPIWAVGSPQGNVVAGREPFQKRVRYRCFRPSDKEIRSGYGGSKM
jgi:hypothetical protein